MLLSRETYKKILAIDEEVALTPLEMSDKMNVTFFPYINPETSQEVKDFTKNLKKIFEELKVNIVPFEKSLTKVPYRKIIKSFLKILGNNLMYIIRLISDRPQKNIYFNFQAIKYVFKRKKVKKGISIIATGEQDISEMPMEYITSFKDSSVISILDFPKNISKDSSFNEHFDMSMNLFVHNMSNIILGVDKEKFILYNFNGSHPIYPIDENLKEYLLGSLIPKIVAPIRPYKLEEFILSTSNFSINDSTHTEVINDLVVGAKKFAETNLYPKGKKIDELPFRNKFFKWIGQLHLDHRNGMSFGFLAHQLPGEVEKLTETTKTEDFFVDENNNFHIVIPILGKRYDLLLPTIWVISQKSGSDKTNFIPERDLIKMGLTNGKMIIETSIGKTIDPTYKPSFDTKVILAHALGNAIIASIFDHFGQNEKFVEQYAKKGFSLSHWHGYIHPDYIPKNFHVHGIHNPHVACSSPQSAIYALDGKLSKFIEVYEKGDLFMGDIHIEPHHGINVNFFSLSELADYLLKNKSASVLGNKYYDLYNK